jgi:hypothetical protein
VAQAASMLHQKYHVVDKRQSFTFTAVYVKRYLNIFRDDTT